MARPRLYLDEDVSQAVARLLRAGGYDVVSAQEIGALRLTDLEQFRRATADGRVIFSYNARHYWAIAQDEAAAGRSHPGIIVSYRQYERDEVGALVASLKAVLDTHSAEDLEGVFLPLQRVSRQ